MAIPNKDTTPTPIPPPVDQAEADIGYPGIHLIELKIRAIPASASGAIKSDYGVRIYYGVLGDPTALDKFRLATAPASGDDLPHSVFTRKAKHRFDFPEEDRGKTVFLCLRYENSKQKLLKIGYRHQRWWLYADFMATPPQFLQEKDFQAQPIT